MPPTKPLPRRDRTKPRSQNKTNPPKTWYGSEKKESGGKRATKDYPNAREKRAPDPNDSAVFYYTDLAKQKLTASARKSDKTAAKKDIKAGRTTTKKKQKK